MGYRAKMIANLLILKARNREYEKLANELIGKIITSDMSVMDKILCEIYEKVNDQGVVGKIIPSSSTFLSEGEFSSLDIITQSKIIWLSNISDYLYRLHAQGKDRYSEFRSLALSICKLSKDNLLDVLYEILVKLYSIFKDDYVESEKIISEKDVREIVEEFF